MCEHATLLQPPTPPASAKAAERAGYLQMLSASAIFSVFVLLQRDAVGRLHLAGTTAFLLQAAIVLVLSAAFLPCQALGGQHLLLEQRGRLRRRDTAALLLVRGVVGAAGVLCGTLSYVHLPAGLALSLFFTCPLFAALFARLLLGERVSAADVAAMVAAAAGVALIALPGLRVRSGADDTQLAGVGVDVGVGVGVGVGFALLSAMCKGLGIVLVRMLGSCVHFGVPVACVAACGVALGLFAGGASGFDVAADAALALPLALMGAAGLLSFFAGLAETAGAQKIPSGIATLLKAVEVPLTFCLGTVFLKEFPTLQKLLGSALVVLAAVFVTVPRTTMQNTNGG